MIQIKALSKEFEPTKGTPGSSALDLYAAESAIIYPHDHTMVAAGIYIAIPEGYVGLIWPRSGLDSKKSVTRGAGCLDPDYRDEVKVLLRNHSQERYHVQRGDRIAQLVVVPCVTDYTVTDTLPDPGSEHGGFGSTGR